MLETQQKTLKEYAQEYSISLDDRMISDFSRYTELLLEWNQKMNLTAITQPREIIIKHYLDSLLLTTVQDFSKSASFIDVGTGAGFPSVPLKIVHPELSVTMLDSLNKRLLFLKALSEELGQQNTLLHGRAEQCAREPHLRESFDFAAARALAALPALCEYCLPFVKVGGIFFAMKGGDVDEEISLSQRAIALLGGKFLQTHFFTLPNGDRRSIVCIKKISQTPTKYPRISVKISKSPL